MISQRILDEHNLPDYLIGLGILAPGDLVAVEPAGDGNINWVRRARAADGRTWIVKQARGALEKFPQYEADTSRLKCEARYLEVARSYDFDGVLPGVHHFDERHRVLVLEDIGPVPHMGERLLAGADLDGDLERIARLLARVHEATAGVDLAPSFANEQMRRLHGDHIFVLPFRPNDFDLAPRVAERAESVWQDDELVEAAGRAYRRYLEPHGALVHADVQSSNVLLAPDRPVLLDAEIAHVGDSAFDVGTLIAHVFLPAIARHELERARATCRRICRAYGETRDFPEAFAKSAENYAAFEMIRRTIGAARVPAMSTAEASLDCLDLALPVAIGRGALIS
jgi:5-methylthioribose kinase